MKWPHSQHVVVGEGECQCGLSTPKMMIGKKVLTSSVGRVTSPSEQYGHIVLYIKAESLCLFLEKDKTIDRAPGKCNATKACKAK